MLLMLWRGVALLCPVIDFLPSDRAGQTCVCGAEGGREPDGEACPCLAAPEKPARLRR